jgi:hypothetical protein
MQRFLGQTAGFLARVKEGGIFDNLNPNGTLSLLGSLS